MYIYESFHNSLRGTLEGIELIELPIDLNAAKKDERK